MNYSEVLKRIETALSAVREVIKDFTPGKIRSTLKDSGDPVPEADVRLDNILKQELPRDDVL